MLIPLLIWCAVVSLLTCGAFWVDKQRARRCRRRVPERVLLVLALIGGWTGAKVGQHLFRHKTRKQPFGHLLNAIGALHLLLVWLML